jgi:PAS domain S-box-containing protein
MSKQTTGKRSRKKEKTGPPAQQGHPGKRFFDMLPLPCHCLDGQGVVVDVNLAWLALTGRTRDEAAGRPAADFLADRSRAVLREALASFPERPLELVMVRSDGVEVEVVADVRLDNGEFGAAQIHFLRRVEPRQEPADPETVHAAAMHKLLAENTEDVIWTLDTDYRYTYVSPSIVRVRGVAPEEIVGTRVDNAVTPESLPSLHKALCELRESVSRGKSGSAVRLEVELRHVGESTLWVEVVARPLVDENGKCVGFTGSSRNIGDRREMERRLRESEGAMRALLEATDEALGLFDIDGKALTVNSSLAAAFGLDSRTMSGVCVFDMLSREKAETWRESFRQVAMEGRPLTRGGSFGDRVYEITLSPAPALSDGPARVALFARDVTEKTRADAALRESEARYRCMVETANEGILSMDAHGRITFANPTTAEFLGHELKDLLGATFADLLPPEDHHLHLDSARTVMDGKQRFEQRFLRGNGAEAWGRVSVSPVLNEAGEYLGAFAMIADITESKLIERSLRESESRYRRIVETANEGIIFTGPMGNIRFVNKVLCRMFGYAVYELLGKPLSMLFYDEDLPALDEQLRRKRQGLSDQVEQRYRRKDGGHMWGLVSASPVYGDEGRYQGVLAMVADISDRKRAEAELVRSERNYRKIFENSVEGLYRSIPEGRFLSVNPALARLMGYDSPEEFTESITDIATQFYCNPADREILIKALTEHGEIRQFEVLVRRRDGRRVWVSITGRLSRGEPGEGDVFEGSMVDVTDRKRVEEALRLTQFSVDMAPVSIYWIESSGRIIYVNEHACASLGYEREALLRMTVADISGTITHDQWPEHWAARRGYETRRFETTHLRRDGREIVVDLLSHYKVYGGKEYLFAYAFDLTERHKTEQALRWSRELLNEVQRISLTGGWEYDLKTGESHWTDGQFRLLGLEPGAAAPHVVTVLERRIHPDDRRRLVETWTTLLRERKPLETEFRCIADDGSERILVGVIVPELDDQGRLLRVFGSTRDVTRERQAARELKLSHERLLAILDGIDADIYVSELDGHDILFMNSHIRESYGTMAADALCYELFRGRAEQCPFCPKPSLLDENGAPVATIVQERFNPLTNRWYLNHDRAIEWLEGRLVHMHMAADITDLKVMEQELKLAMAEAEAANMAKNEFLANMSHEIRTPLNGLLGMLQLLQLAALEAEQRDYLEIAVSSGRSLLQILNDILDISKIESGKLELVDQPLELADVLDSVVSVFRHQAGMRGIDVTRVVDESLPRHFLADRVRLRQILFNLIGNATKFTESGSVVVEAYPLGLAAPDGRTRLLFSVTDTGIGIPDDKMDTVFDPFTQVDGSFTRKYQGTGLGLGIVRRLVTLMGGTISVTSELGKGTAVVFTVLARPMDLPEPAPVIEMSGRATRSLSLLVVEDERTNRVVAERLLGKLGHRATCVESGEEALDRLASETYDCVLMDIQMPGLDGMETTRAIRGRLGLRVPVVALTAHAMEGDRERFIKAGMQGYVAKPFDMDELGRELERVMAEAEAES